MCITYDTSWLLSAVTLYGYVSQMVHTTCLLTTSQWRPLQCIITVTPQQEIHIWKYVYCIIYGTECSEGLNPISN
jgi:hypothetical protein